MQFFSLVHIDDATSNSDIYGALCAKIGRKIENGGSYLIRKQNDPQFFTTRRYSRHFAGCELLPRAIGLFHSAKATASSFRFNIHSISKRYSVDGNARTVILNVEFPNKFGSPVSPDVLPINLYRSISDESNPRPIGKTKLLLRYLVGADHRDPHEQGDDRIETGDAKCSYFKAVSTFFQGAAMVTIAILAMKINVNLFFKGVNKPIKRAGLCSAIGFALCMFGWALILCVGFVSHFYS